MKSNSWRLERVAERLHEDAERGREQHLGHEVATEQHDESARRLQTTKHGEGFVDGLANPTEDVPSQPRDREDHDDDDGEDDPDHPGDADRRRGRTLEVDVERQAGEQQQRREQQGLHDEAADAVERAGGDRSAGSDALTLEEPDVHGDASGGSGDGEVDVRDRELQGIHRPERHGDGSCTEGRHGLGHPRELRDHETDDHEPPGGVLQRVGELLEVEAGERRQQHHDRQRRQRHPDDRPEREPAHLDQRGRLDARSLGDLGPQLVEVDVECLHHPSLVSGERGRLEVREQPFDLVEGSLLDESFDGEVPPEQPDRRGEELRVVAAQLRRCRRDGGAAEVDDTEPTVVEDEMVLVELAVGDPVVVECREQFPEFTRADDAPRRR